MKITIYELLGLIKDGKAPSKIKFCENIYEWDEDSKFYLTQKKSYKVFLGGSKGDINILFNAFNENVEILEEVEDKEYEDIEEIDIEELGRREDFYPAKQDRVLQNEINVLIRNQKKILERLDK